MIIILTRVTTSNDPLSGSCFVYRPVLCVVTTLLLTGVWVLLLQRMIVLGVIRFDWQPRQGIVVLCTMIEASTEQQ